MNIEQEQNNFIAELSDRVIHFHAPNDKIALNRAKFYEKNIRLRKLYQTSGTAKRAVYDHLDDFGVLPKPPKNWKWFWKVLFQSWVLAPLTPFVVFAFWLGDKKIPKQWQLNAL